MRRWVLSRQRPVRAQTLTQNRIFILPTRAGAGWLLLLLLMLVMAVNYENNLIYALTFLLLGVFLAAIFQTYANLAGIRVRVLQQTACFAGEHAGVELELQPPAGRSCTQIRLRLERSPLAAIVDLHGPQRVRLFCPTVQRGWLQPGGLKLASDYPLGLFRAWSWLNLEVAVLVYPRPLDTPLPPWSAAVAHTGLPSLGTLTGDDDFAGLERFQPGMSPRQVDWKSYARGRGLQAKHFSGQRDPDLWLDLEALGGEALERRLSRLTGWVLALARADRRYGLRLGSTVLPPQRGEPQRLRALTALALYGQERST